MSILGSLITDRYRIQRKLGEGGMAIVYLAQDEKLGRHVAVKILREKFESHHEIRTRFQHEARAISAFDHPNILKVYDYSGAQSQQLWIVTELIHGRNLGQIVETSPGGWLHPVIAACIVREICKALTLAHSEGIVHRDVKPENVMITQHGVIKLMDFGIAKIREKSSMTQTGMFMGSPSYMSPEQVRGRDIDHRSDIYSLGVLFYEIVTGRLPYTGQSTADVAMKILEGHFQHPRFLKEHLPSELNDLIVSCLASDSKNRPQSAETCGRVIDQFLDRNGFESSAAELDRCFRDPRTYGERLSRLIKQTMIVPMTTRQRSLAADATIKLTKQEQLTQRIQQHNDAAVDQPKAYPFPTIKLTDLQKSHPAHAVPPPPKRKDHSLPQRSLQHAPKRAVAKNDSMTAHLPERRMQQRPQPIRIGTRARVIPRVPQRAVAPVIRYVIHDTDSSSGFFGKFILLALVITLTATFFIVGPEKFKFAIPSTPQSVVKNFKPKPKPNQLNHGEKTSSKTSQAPLPKPAVVVSQTKPTIGDVKLPAPTTTLPAANSTVTETSNKKPFINSARSTPTTKPTAPTPVVPVEKSGAIESKKLATENPAETNIEEPKAIPSKSEEPVKEEEPAKPEAPKGKGSVTISAVPAAEIYLNGRRIGTTNDAGTSSEWIELKSGRHKIELKRSGFASRVEIISVKANEKQRLGPFTLIRETARPQPNVYRLTISTNAPPVQISIVNTTTRSTQAIVLNESSQTVTLERGVYEVTAAKGSDRRRRRLDLTGSNTQITFTADYREEQH